MYKFVKIHNTHYDIKHDFALLCEDYETLADHTMKFFHGEIKKGISDLIHQKETGQHLSSHWAHALQVKFTVEGGNVLEISQDLEKDILQTKMEMIDRHGAIVLRENCSYAPLVDTDVIIDQIESEDILYPGKDESSIRIFQWDGGKHWYAKIGGMDVSDKGKAKWNTYNAAKQAAINCLNSI